MCGIGVYVAKTDIDTTNLSQKLEAINRTQGHRGPDYSDIYYEKYIGLCHTRLSIIDLSEKANQPFISDNNFLIVYNGEVYNYKKLKQQLLDLGHHFRSKSDTEVILKSYMQWGTGSFIKFDGMFAFAIYDKVANKLVVARDRIGIKPVHYYIDDEKIIFASELKAIVKIQDNIQYSHQAINDILMLGHIEGTSTVFEDIYTLPPGEFCEIDLSDFKVKRYTYFDLLAEVNPQKYLHNKDIPLCNFVKELDGLLHDSVKMHLVSDAAVGSLCSGGIDSSLVTAIAKDINPNIKIYHAGVEGEGGEEIYAKKVAEHLKVDINYIRMNRQNYVESLVDVIYHSDSPIYHPNDIPLYHICKLANSQGVKVLLCGEGADELFGGYSWQVNFIRNVALNSKIDSKRFIARVISSFKRRIFKYINYSNEPIYDYIHSAGVSHAYGYAENSMLIKNYSLIYNKGINLIRWNCILDSFNFLNNMGEICGNSIMMDNMLGHLSTILYRTDRMGMMASIENRVPFLENMIISFALNLSLNHKIGGNGGKKVLKLVAKRYLPKEIIYRRKEGFPVPWTKYIRYNNTLFKDGFISNHFCISSKLIQRVTNNDLYLLFRLLSIEIWGRIYVYNEDLNGIRRLVCQG